MFDLKENDELAMNWKPISTAPKDRVIMLWWKNQCWWGRKLQTTEPGHTFASGPYKWLVIYGDSYKEAEPTHWQSVPIAPVGEQ